MKIAVVTDDGKTVSRHFGRAGTYAVVSVEDGAIVYRELRNKAARHWQAERPHEDDGARDARGTGLVAQEKHLAMLSGIRDCAAMIAGGMGRGAYDQARVEGISPVVTSIRDVDEAAIA